MICKGVRGRGVLSLIRLIPSYLLRSNQKMGNYVYGESLMADS